MISNKKINIIIGSVNTGKSYFLQKIIDEFTNMSICLIDGDDAGSFFYGEKPSMRINNKNEIRSYEMVNSINDLDLLLIDDFHYLSLECQKEVLKSKIPVILTSCMTYLDKNIELDIFDRENTQIFHISSISGKTQIQHDNTFSEISVFLKTIKRDTKINSILNE
jgi:uridine kinase